MRNESHEFQLNDEQEWLVIKALLFNSYTEKEATKKLHSYAYLAEKLYLSKLEILGRIIHRQDAELDKLNLALNREKQARELLLSVGESK
jgi:hypothetical protein